MGHHRYVCRHTPIVDIRPGDTVLNGWRRVVASNQADGGRHHLVFENGTRTAWMAADTDLPVEVREIGV